MTISGHRWQLAANRRRLACSRQQLQADRKRVAIDCRLGGWGGVGWGGLWGWGVLPSRLSTRGEGGATKAE